MDISVTKRNGRMEPLMWEKVNRQLVWAADGLDVSVSEVELKAKVKLVDGMKTSDIHKELVKTAADLISEKYPDYQYMAARLAMFDVRKQVFGAFNAPTLLQFIRHMVAEGLYDGHLLQDYSKSELRSLDSMIVHDRDMDFAYAGVKQLIGKYLVQNRVTGELYETPQFLYMAIGMALFANYPRDTRLQYVREFYDAVSTFEISLPTPIMGGVRTPTRQFSSCVKIECGDSLDSINASASSIIKYISQRAGIGINAGRIRAIGSPIRGGEAVHTGCLPFYKHFQSAVKSCSQGALRGGAATLFYPMWHYEFEELIVLKNNRGVDDNRVRHLDYGVQLNKTMYSRLVQNKDITLFSPSDVDGLYDAFFNDQELFERLYTEAENDPTIRKKTIKAVDAFSTLMQERAGTGRIYVQHVDHCNIYGPFDESVAPIRQSNLCMEIALPTKPLNDVNDEDGEIALCTLSAFNLGKVNSPKDFERLSNIVVRALDALLDYQDYPIKAAKISTMNRRSLGVGVVNLAYFLAKNGVKYSDGSANNIVHEYMEAMQYYLIKASMELAKEKCACHKFNETKYAKGIMPIDRYKNTVDGIAKPTYNMDWDWLRTQVMTYGMRNSTLSCAMPSETSSQISNATNGIEPPRGYVSIKQSKDGVLKQVVPEFKNLSDKYELLWDIKSNKGYIDLVAIMQKFMDQSLSANTNYIPADYPNSKVPMKLLLSDLAYAYRMGLKTLYYHNTNDGSGENIVEESDECSSCKI